MCRLVFVQYLAYPLDIPLHAVIAELTFSVLAVDQILQRVFAKLEVLGKFGTVVSPCPAARDVDSERSATHDSAPSVDYQPPDSVMYLRRLRWGSHALCGCRISIGSISSPSLVLLVNSLSSRR